MKIVRKSPISEVIHIRDMDITQEQLEKWINGALIQDAFPHLSLDDREFIKTGITPTEWIEIFGDDNAKH